MEGFCMDKFDVVVLGGGASGTICAINASRKHSKVLIIDASDCACKKLLVTGNGKCNFTNIYATSKNYNCNIDSYLERFSVDDLLSFFNSIGLEYYVDGEGRCYPLSNTAKSVIDVLNNALSKTLVKYKKDVVNKISQTKNKEYLIECSNYSCIACRLVVALGGLTESKIKAMFDNIKVDTSEVEPSLVALKTYEQTKSLEGVRVSNVKMKATCCRDEFEGVGEVLFKHNGLSGIVTFNASTIFARNKNFNGVVIINLLPGYSKDDLIKIIKKNIKVFTEVDKLFSGVLHPAVAHEVINRAGLKNKKETKLLSFEDIEKLVDVIINFRFTICDVYDNNQVVSGGVSLNSLTNNLESKDNPNLYFCGEVCDVDGECGGYNLQWAWTSGFIVGDSL